ncbi:MAG: type II toxin-antitoxin system VapC family toxin [bacterium]
MKLYAESSAILSWLLGERAGQTAQDYLAEAETVVTSTLTFVECERAFVRASVESGRVEARLAHRRGLLAKAGAHWHRVPVSDDVLETAKRSFPVEPVRTLDAIHLASALLTRAEIVELALLSLDRRVREAAAALGFEVLPPVSDR